MTGHDRSEYPVARRGIYDNMKTAVDKVKKGKGRIVNARFAVMRAHSPGDADFCNVASGWEKGVVEKNVQDSRRRIWIDAQTRKWGSFEELNAWLGTRCRALWGEIRHPEYKQFSVAEMLGQERAELMPMPTVFDGYVERSAKVSSTCLVTVARNRYSAPCELAGQRVSTRAVPQSGGDRHRRGHPAPKVTGDMRLAISCSDTLSRKYIRRILPNISMVITLFVLCPKFGQSK